MGLFDFNTGFSKEDKQDCSDGDFVVDVGHATAGIDKVLGSLSDISNQVDGNVDQAFWQDRINPVLFRAQALRSGMMGQDDNHGLTRDQMTQFGSVWDDGCGIASDFDRRGSIGKVPSTFDIAGYSLANTAKTVADAAKSAANAANDFGKSFLSGYLKVIIPLAIIVVSILVLVLITKKKVGV
jgi:hypothetical protein